MMKRANTFFSILSGLVLIASCKEENPGIILEKPAVTFTDTTYIAPTAEVPQAKNVLVEDITGVRCTNCPKGHDAIHQMQQNHPGRIVALSIHGYPFPFFTTPLDSTKDVDMRIPNVVEGIFNIVGTPGGLPFGTIDRVQNSATADNWEAIAVGRMALPTRVNLYIEKQYDAGSRELQVKLKAVFNDSMGDKPYFTIGIYENGIITPQKDERLASDPVKKGIEPNYEHNHILRFVGAFKSDLLPASIPLPEKNRVVEKTFSLTANTKWNMDNCYLVFYVHRDKEILQATELKIK